MTTQTIDIDETKLEAFVGQVVTDLSASNSGFLVSIGHKLGLYEALAGAGPLSSDEVAERSGCAERYVREWLNNQVAGGYIDYHADTASYELSAEHAAVLADPESPVFMPPAYELTASLWSGEQRTLDAFRTGAGVSWGDHDGRLSCGIAAFYRNGYAAYLVQEWLPALDGVVPKLEAGARVADIGCGHGHSTVLMAKAFPNSRFYGFDTHEESIEVARANAEAAGVSDRVTFETRSATDHPDGKFDLIAFFDCLHDLGDPVGAAAHARSALAEGGTVMLVEPYANDRVEDNVGPVGRLYYAGSTALCCAHALSEGGGHALGAQAGESRLAEVFDQAGFGHWRRAAETPFNLILEARA